MSEQQPDTQTSAAPIPPNNPVAEAALLAAMMWAVHPELAKRYAGELTEEDFYRSRHKVVFRAIAGLVADGDPADVVTVHARLRERGWLDDVGGMKGLMDLWDVTPTAVYHEAYARAVRALRARRDLVNLGGDVARSAASCEDETDELVAATESRLTEIAALKPASRPVLTMAEAVELTRARIDRSMTEESSAGIPSGFHDLDALIGGFEGEKLSILAGRPGMGKSSLALQVLKQAACRAHPVLFFSVEMGVEETVRRYIAQGLDIPTVHLRDGSFPRTLAQRRRLEDASVSLAILPIAIDGTPQIEVPELRQKARAWAARQCDGGKVGLIVIDHLQLVQSPGFGPDKRHFELASITRAMKGLARETHCHVMLLSQLSRKLEDRQDKRPILSDLRESGAIEEDADLVLFVFREGYYTKQPSDAEIIIAKQRSGTIGAVEVPWHPRLMLFGELPAPAQSSIHWQEERS